MNILPDFGDSGPWIVATNLFWFIAGFLSCYALVHFGILTINFFHRGTPMTETTSETRGREENGRRRQSQAIRAGLFVLIGMLVFGTGVRVGYELLAQKVECFDDYAAANAEALQARAEAATLENEANRDIWAVQAEAAGLLRDDPSKPLPPGEEERLNTKLVEALIHYQEVIEEIEEKRKNNPIPEPPRKVC